MSRRAKPVGLIEPSPSKQLLRKTVQEIISEGKRMILTTYEYERGMDIFIGNHNIYCARVELFRNREGEWTDYANLDKIRWDAECSLDAAFEQGKDTTMLFRLIVSYIYKTFDGKIKTVRFNDASNRRCDNGATVSLSAMKMFTDGNTWYESHVGATIVKEDEAAYRHQISLANDTKQGMTWGMAKKEIEWEAAGIPEDELKKQYEQYETWTPWFKWIRNEIGPSAFCIWLGYKGWFNTFLASVLRFDIMRFHFMVETASYHQEYTMKGGKRRNTRKRSKGVLLQH